MVNLNGTRQRICGWHGAAMSEQRARRGGKSEESAITTASIAAWDGQIGQVATQASKEASWGDTAGGRGTCQAAAYRR